MNKTLEQALASSVCHTTSIDKLPDAIIGLDSVPCRLRFLDCDAFLDDSVLRILEYDDTPLSEISYSVVSYPWRDLQMPLDKTPPEGSFGVVGAEHADPISIDVLRTICTAVRVGKLSLVWIDRLCMLQNNKQDKAWQIQHMYELYAKCQMCLVVPGGLVRLAELTDTTCWADRAWTLQEAAAPQGAQGERLNCVFSFTHPSFENFIQQYCETQELSEGFKKFLRMTKHNPVQNVLSPGHSAMGPLWSIFHMLWGWTGAFKYHQPGLDPSEYHSRLPVRIVRETQASLLRRAMSLHGVDIWRAAYTRTSSRPVDMIFSIMGLFGITLPVGEFSAEDRVKATIRLLQELMNRDGQIASWLYIAPELPPSRYISTLPVMPETSESGRAYVKTHDGVETANEVIQERWDIRGAPVGKVDDMGYFIFSARAAEVIELTQPHGNDSGYQTPSGQFQETSKTACNRRTRWAIEIGSHQEFNEDPVTGKIKGTKPGDPRPAGFTDLILMFVESHGDEMYDRIGMERHIDESKTTGWNWNSRQFRVGGQGQGVRVRLGISPSGPVDTRDAIRHFGPDLSDFHNKNRDVYVFDK